MTGFVLSLQICWKALSGNIPVTAETEEHAACPICYDVMNNNYFV
jgi:hypothetical protein